MMEESSFCNEEELVKGLDVELQQRGYVRIPRSPDGSAAAAQLDAEELWWSRQMQRTPEEMLDAYFGLASDWTFEVKPGTELGDEELQSGLQRLDRSLEQVGQLVTRAVSSFLPRIVGRSAGLLHCHCCNESEKVYFDPPPKLTDPFEAGPYLQHCSLKKVVLLYCFDITQLVLRPRSQPSDKVDILMKPGDVLVYLHQMLDLSVESCCPAGSCSTWAGARGVLPGPHTQLGLLFQLDLHFERPVPHKAKQELVPLPSRLLEKYKSLFESVEMEPEQMHLISLKDLQLDYQLPSGISIAALHTALPTLPGGARMGAAIEATLLGGLDPVTQVLAPPQKCSRSCEMRERQYFGAKWDLSEYYDELSADTGDAVKVYSKHLSVLYQSYDVAGDFDYSVFGFDLQESYQLDQRCRLLCEGHAEVLHSSNEWRSRSEPSRDWGLFVGLSGLGEGWSLSFHERSKPSTILGKVSKAFNFSGPAEVRDTDDSSGLVACDLAVQQLREGICPVALASSASFISSPLELALHCRAGVASRSGRTRCFDSSGDGFTQGEGAVVLMLRPSKNSERGWNVVGSAVSSRGQDATLRAPSAAAMQDALAKASRDAQVSFMVVDAVETNSQGQPGMDASELLLLGKALRHKDQEMAPVMTSCSKASWGHLGPVSGLLGVARSLLLMVKNICGPQLHLRQLLSDNSENLSRVHFCTEATQTLGQTQLLSVASFGGGTNCHQLISVKNQQKAKPPAKLSWYPTENEKKDVLKVINGYQLVGSATVWKDGLPLKPHPDDPTSFSCLVTLPLSGCERFQIWIDGDPDRVLYPVASGTSESMVMGPEKQVDRSKSWTLRDAPGHRYEIRLQVNGKEKRVCWQKVSLTPLPVQPRCLSIMGDHTFGVIESMKVAGEWNDIFEASVRLLKETSNFWIFCDEDLDQSFYPAPDSIAEVMLQGGDAAAPWTGLQGSAILGPDEHGEGKSFQITGEVGDVYRLVFNLTLKTLQWQRVDHGQVDWQEEWSRQKCYVAGSWNNFQTCEEMQFDEGSGCRSLEVVLSSSKETFQILVNRSWFCTLHGSQSASYSDALEGPDDRGRDHYWRIGEDGDLEPGDLVEIRVEMEPMGRPSKVWWNKSTSARAHKLHYCRGVQRTKQRHLRLHGLQPFDSITRRPARLIDPPEFFTGGRVKEETSTLRLFFEKYQESVFAWQKHVTEEGPEAQLAAANAREFEDFLKAAPADTPVVVI